MKRTLGMALYRMLAIWVPRRMAGRVLRRAFGRMILGSCGRNVAIEKGNELHHRLHLGNRVQIGAGCRFMIGARVDLEDDVLLAPEVVFIDSNHRFDRTDVPINRQGRGVPRPIRVEEGAWIGIRAIILPGVTIGSHAIVGAGAVVRQDVPSYGVVAGNPAVLVRRRESGDGGRVD